MSPTPSAGTQICPNCGASNSAFSIFCAECGTSLGTSRDADDRDDTGQSTVTFAPVAQPDEPEPAAWTSANDTQTTQEFTPQESTTDTTAEYASSWEQPESYGLAEAHPSAQSRRGFILGIIACVLIAIVVGFFFWSSIVSEGFRDSITGLF